MDIYWHSKIYIGVRESPLYSSAGVSSWEYGPLSEQAVQHVGPTGNKFRDTHNIRYITRWNGGIYTGGNTYRLECTQLNRRDTAGLTFMPLIGSTWFILLISVHIADLSWAYNTEIT